MSRKIISSVCSMLLIVCVIASGAVSAAATGIVNHITVTSYNDKLDYMIEIQKVLTDGGQYAMQVGAIYEKQRNLKIEKLSMDTPRTNYFERFTTANDILRAMEEDNRPKYNAEDLYWLSRVIHAEAGSSWIPDCMQQYVGSVVLNRVKDSRFAGSVKGVVFQKGQYACTVNGSIYRTPSAQAEKNAKYLLGKGSQMPVGVVGQSQFIQGRIHKSYYDAYLGTTTYFCYM